MAYQQHHLNVRSAAAGQYYASTASPRPVVPRRHAVDLTGSGVVKSDYWHRGMASEVVSRNHNQDPCIRFFPVDGVGAGVALTECEYGQGMALPHESILTTLPPDLHRIESGFLVITWPGYQHLRWKHKISFVRADRTPATIREMASQVAGIWRRFYQTHHDNFEGNGILLGPSDVTFSHLRLHQIYTHDGRTWQAEISYITS